MSSIGRLNRLLTIDPRDPDAVAPAMESSLAEIDATLAARPEAFTSDLAMSFNNLGARLADLGQREAALAAAQEAVDLRRVLTGARPDAFIPDLAMSLSTLGLFLAALGQHEPALAAAQEAVDLYRGLAAARPDAFTQDIDNGRQAFERWRIPSVN